MKWGLLGGTFDPIHVGHLRCAEEVLEIFDLNRIIFVPASLPPHKLDARITPFRHREQMIKLAIDDNPVFSFSSVERERQGTSYSVETVEHFQQKYMKDLELYFIVGQDAFQAIRTWKDWQRLLTMCHFVVMTRPGYASMTLEGVLPAEFSSSFVFDEEAQGYRGATGRMIYFRQVTFLDISSSDIRRRVREGKSIRYIVPDAVRHYLAKHSLYGAG